MDNPPEWIISPADLRKVMSYDPETGVLVWKAREIETFTGEKVTARWVAAWNKRYAGKPALNSRSAIYRNGLALNQRLLAHRAAWAIHYDQWPKGEIDHINGDGSDNRIANLRDVPPVLNKRNRPLNPRNSSGVSGVRWSRQAGSWVVTLGGRGKKYIGSFKDFNDAVAARMQAEQLNQYHPNHGRIGSIVNG